MQAKPDKVKGIIWIVVAVLALMYFVLWGIASWQRSFQLGTGGSFLKQMEAAGILSSEAAQRDERIVEIRKKAAEAIEGTRQDGRIAQVQKKASEALEAAKQDGRLAQIVERAKGHGRICATLMVLGMQPPLFGLLVTTIGIIMRFESVRVRRVLITAFFLSCLWGTFFFGASNFTLSRTATLSRSSRGKPFIILLAGAFMVWAAVTACFGLIIGLAALVRRLLGIPSNRLKVKCPKCGHALSGATRQMIGEIGVCPKCKAEFVIGEVDTEDKKPQLTATNLE